ncbi:hypothetical protein GF318_03220 [Candidatus Micrarchaeota archaeon]|nr:hypothetical protein [Candidatus Micrarchaeota archaeon]
MVAGKRLSLPERVKNVGVERQRTRQKELDAAKRRHEGLSKRSGSYAVGRDEYGFPVDTRKASALGMRVESWFVTMGFRREDSKAAHGLSMEDAESTLKNGTVPRRTVRMSTHIITAVRTLKHVHERYGQELASKDEFLSWLDGLNLRIADQKSKATDADIDRLIRELDTVRGWLKRRRLAIHRAVSEKRLEDTIQGFGQAKGAGGGSRAVLLSRACARFTALRNRLGSWRDRQIAGLVEYTRQRECSLRVERDRWLLSQFAKYTRIPRKMAEYHEIDQQKREKMELVKKHVEQGEHSKAMRCLWANRELLTGYKSRGFIPGRVGWIHRHIKGGQVKNALEKIDYYLLYTVANKPGFILDELSKEPDPYLEATLEHLGKAVRAFEAQDFKAAQAYFVDATREMRGIVMG